MRPRDEFIATAFWELSNAIDALDSMPDDDLTFVCKVKDRAEQLQSAADNPARTKCPKCPNMMVNPRPCMNPDCGFRK